MEDSNISYSSPLSSSSSSSSLSSSLSSSPLSHRKNTYLCETAAECGEGAECVIPFQGDPKQCFCVHHLRYPREDTGECSTFETESPPPKLQNSGVIFHHQIKGLFFKNLTTTTTTTTTRITPSKVNLPVIVTSTVIFVVLVVVAIVCLLRRRRALKRKPKKIIKTEAGISLLDQMNTMSRNPTYFCPKIYPEGLAATNIRVVPMDHLRLLETVGEGAFGQVFKGYLYMPEDDEYVHVAVKVLKEGASSEAYEDFQREVDIMASFDHHNILKLLGVVTQERSPFMIFEFMEHGDLNELLRQQDRHHPMKGASRIRIPLTKDDLVDFSLQIAKGMSYLATQRFVHRDLATRNCLVNSKMTVKISDFGMSHDVYNCDYYKINGNRMVPVRWLSPEAVKFGRFTTESDIWAYGVVLWEIFSYGTQPYYGHANEEVIGFLDRGILLQHPGDCPSAMYHAMRSCWRHDPKQRIPFGRLVRYLTCFKERLASGCASMQTRVSTSSEDMDALLQIQTEITTPTPSGFDGLNNAPVHCDSATSLKIDICEPASCNYDVLGDERQDKSRNRRHSINQLSSYDVVLSDIRISSNVGNISTTDLNDPGQSSHEHHTGVTTDNNNECLTNSNVSATKSSVLPPSQIKKHSPPTKSQAACKIYRVTRENNLRLEEEEEEEDGVINGDQKLKTTNIIRDNVKHDLGLGRHQTAKQSKKNTTVSGLLLSRSCRDLCAVAASCPSMSTYTPKLVKKSLKSKTPPPLRYFTPLNSNSANNSQSNVDNRFNVSRTRSTLGLFDIASFSSVNSMSTNFIGRLERKAIVNTYSNSINELDSFKSCNDATVTMGFGTNPCGGSGICGGGCGVGGGHVMKEKHWQH